MVRFDILVNMELNNRGRVNFFSNIATLIVLMYITQQHNLNSYTVLKEREFHTSGGCRSGGVGQGSRAMVFAE